MGKKKRETKMSDSETKNVTVHVNFIYYLLIYHVFVPMVKLIRLIKLRWVWGCMENTLNNCNLSLLLNESYSVYELAFQVNTFSAVYLHFNQWNSH